MHRSRWRLETASQTSSLLGDLFRTAKRGRVSFLNNPIKLCNLKFTWSHLIEEGDSIILTESPNSPTGSPLRHSGLVPESYSLPHFIKSSSYSKLVKSHHLVSEKGHCPADYGNLTSIGCWSLSGIGWTKVLNARTTPLSLLCSSLLKSLSVISYLPENRVCSPWM